MERPEMPISTPEGSGFEGLPVSPDTFLPDQTEQVAPAEPGRKSDIAAIEEQIITALQSDDVSEAPSAPIREVPPSTSAEPTFLDRHPTLGKLARGLMFVGGLGMAGSALGADKQSAEKPKGDEVVSTVIVNGKIMSSTRSPQGKTITGATISRDGKTITVDGKKSPLPKGASVSVTQNMDVVEGTVVGVELK